MTRDEAAAWVKQHEADEEDAVVGALMELVNGTVDRCAKAGVAAVNDCRGEGETDLRSVRSFVDQAIRDPAGYAEERKEAAR